EAAVEDGNLRLRDRRPFAVDERDRLRRHRPIHRRTWSIACLVSVPLSTALSATTGSFCSSLPSSVTLTMPSDSPIITGAVAFSASVGVNTSFLESPSGRVRKIGRGTPTVTVSSAPFQTRTAPTDWFGPKIDTVSKKRKP